MTLEELNHVEQLICYGKFQQAVIELRRMKVEIARQARHEFEHKDEQSVGLSVDLPREGDTILLRARCTGVTNPDPVFKDTRVYFTADDTHYASTPVDNIADILRSPK